MRGQHKNKQSKTKQSKTNKRESIYSCTIIIKANYSDSAITVTGCRLVGGYLW